MLLHLIKAPSNKDVESEFNLDIINIINNIITGMCALKEERCIGMLLL